MRGVLVVCDRDADNFQHFEFIRYHNINDIQHYQLNDFLLKFVCVNNSRVMLAVDNVSILYTNVL